jgi:hypothetical protein
LLDDAGNIRPQYKAPGDAQFSPNITDTGETPRDNPRQQIDAVDDTIRSQHLDDVSYNLPDAHEEGRSLANPLKRKLHDMHPRSWSFDTIEDDLSQHLPSQPVLCKVVDFFCISKHHWIPYLHKKRLQTRIREVVHNAGLDLLLHALVATTLRHMDPDMLFLDRGHIEQQIRLSYTIVETRCLQDVTIESLQALILIVFDHVSNAHKLWGPSGKPTLTVDSSTMGRLKELGRLSAHSRGQLITCS